MYGHKYKYRYFSGQIKRKTGNYDSSIIQSETVKRAVYLLQAFLGDMSVNLSGLAVFVPQQLLYVPQVSSGLKEVSGITVSQTMKCYDFLQAGPDAGCPEDLLHAGGAVHASLVLTFKEEEGRLVTHNVTVKHLNDTVREGHHPVFKTL